MVGLLSLRSHSWSGSVLLSFLSFTSSPSPSSGLRPERRERERDRREGEMVRIEDVNSLGLEIPFVFTHSISSSSYTPRSEERSRRSRMSATRWPDGWYGVSRACKEMRKESDTVRATDEGRRDLSSLTFHLLTLFILSLPWSFYTSSLFVCSLQSHPRSRGERRTTDRERG